MKQLKIAAVAVMVLATFSIYAADPGSNTLRVQVIPKADQTFKVIYESEEKAEVKINIYDSQSNRIFSDRITATDGFSKPYNFKNLPTGQYTFEIISNGAKSKEVVNNHIEAPRPTMKALVYPMETAGKFQLMVMSNHMSPVTISIFDKNDKVLHEEQVDADKTFGKVYDLVGTHENGARFVVMSKDTVLKDQHFNW